MNPQNSRKLLLVIHGKVAGEIELREAVETVRAEGVSVDVRVTWEAGDADRYAQEAVERNVDVLVVAGGDGTLNEAVHGIYRANSNPDIALAVLPFGTANDFATSCGIVDRSVLDFLRLAATGDKFPIDVGLMNGRHFLNLVSGGFGAEVTANTPDELKRMLGGAAYSLMGFLTAFRFQPHRAEIRFEDQALEDNFVMVAVGNGRQCGGGYRLTPRALLDDGLLDLVVIRDAGVSTWGTAYQELANPDWEENQYVEYHQSTGFVITSEEPLQVNLDGEPMVASRFEFAIAENPLLFVLPPECVLLTKNSPA